MKARFIIIAVLVLTSQMAIAQEEGEDMKAPLHLSLITPLGTNGLQSWNTTNNLSVNLIAGFSGGLNGIEWAGFANVLKGDMKGVQFAGFCNNTMGVAHGAELAGFWNYNHQYVKGFQASGFANVALEYVDGFQASGFANYADGCSFGQFTGFANVCTDKLSGVQASGFANLATGNVKGVQGTGFANVTIGDHKGVQGSGFSNIVTGKMTGLQASGFFNYTETLKGVQVGVFNYADTVESGVPLGLFSYVKEGYRVLELGGNESLLANVSLKSGVERLYNIVSIGGKISDDRLLWGWGLGLGTMMPVTGKLKLSLEAICYHLNDDAWWSGNLNLLNRASASLSYDISSKFSVFAGPALNVWVTNTDSHGDAYTEAPFTKWTAYSKSRHRTEVTIYPGLSAGVRVALN